MVKTAVHYENFQITLPAASDGELCPMDFVSLLK